MSRTLEQYAEDLRQTRTELRAQLAKVEQALAVLEGEPSTTGEYPSLTSLSNAVKSRPMHMQAARVHMSAKKASKLATAANVVGHSVRSLAIAVGEDPRIRGRKLGYTHAQLSAAERGKNPIRRIVAEVVRDLTKHPFIPADPTRGTPAIPAYDGYPVESWPKLID